MNCATNLMTESSNQIHDNLYICLFYMTHTRWWLCPLCIWTLAHIYNTNFIIFIYEATFYFSIYSFYILFGCCLWLFWSWMVQFLCKYWKNILMASIELLSTYLMLSRSISIEVTEQLQLNSHCTTISRPGVTRARLK